MNVVHNNNVHNYFQLKNFFSNIYSIKAKLVLKPLKIMYCAFIIHNIVQYQISNLIMYLREKNFQGIPIKTMHQKKRFSLKTFFTQHLIPICEEMSLIKQTDKDLFGDAALCC